MIHSWLATAMLASGMVLVFLLLGVFIVGKRYLRPAGPDRGVGFVQDRLEAEERVASLAPGILEASGREKALTESLQNGALPEGAARRDVMELLREADVSGLWRSFGTASSLVEDDPRMARAELEALSLRVRSALGRISEAEEACRHPEPRGRGR